MDLITRLRRFAFLHPHLLIVEGPQGTPARLKVEDWARRHGWPEAESPADTDILVLCGQIPRTMVGVVARLQSMLSRPAATLHLAPFPDESSPDRLRVDILTDEAHFEVALAEAARRLQQDLAPSRTPIPENKHGHDHNDAPDGDHSHGTHNAQHDHDNDHNHESDHDHESEHDMQPGGLPMATRAEDRDGLKLDILHVPLGPVLWGWPAGLALLLTLQGDVIQEVTLDLRHLVAYRRAASWWNLPWMDALAGKEISIALVERRRAAAHLDSLTRLLAVAGDEGNMLTAARIRDAVLSGVESAALCDDVARLGRRLKRARLLDRVTDGVGRITQEEATDLGLSGPALRAAGAADDLRAHSYENFQPVAALGEGDARSRWHQWLAEAEQSLHLSSHSDGGLPVIGGQVEGPRGVLEAPPATSAPSRALIDAICATLPGQELAVARLTVAGFDPDPSDLESEVAPKEGEVQP